jgi:hypothetical protein
VSAYGVTIMSLSDPLSNDDRYSRTRLRDRAVTITRKHKTNVAVLLTMTATRNRMARLGGKPEFKIPPVATWSCYSSAIISRARFLTVVFLLSGNAVSAQLNGHQTHQSSTVPALTNTPERKTHLDFRPRREVCAPGLEPRYYLSCAALLLLCAVFFRIKTRSGVGKRQALRRLGLTVFTMALFTWLSLSFLPALQTALTRPGFISGSATKTADAPVFTVPKSADIGLNVIPNILDPQAVNPQDVCPGYKASNIQENDNGFTADLRLAGSACNVYGNDIKDLTLLVRLQAEDRLRIRIQPRYIGPGNETWFLLPEAIVPRPADGRGSYGAQNKLDVSWTNEPSFAFTVKRKNTGDILFTSSGRKLVFEDQFIEFGSPLPESYNLYGLGEVMHGLRLGNNLTRTIFAADVADNIDANLYGSHPIYLDTRYFTKDQSGKLTYFANANDKQAEYVSYTHGVFLRNAHAQEVLLRPSGITWRTLGGSIDLYFYSGPTAEDVTKAYQKSATGLPAMQQYWALGYHQCRWGYKNWTHLQDVVDNFERFQIPLETLWSKLAMISLMACFYVYQPDVAKTDQQQPISTT